MNSRIRLQLPTAILFSVLSFAPAFAQTPPAESQLLAVSESPSEIATPATHSTPSIIDDITAEITPAVAIDKALMATPPQRSAAGRALALNPENLAEIDKWIAATPIDDPQNLKMKDLLLAMPIEQSGPRLVELAKKTTTPAIQENWTKWLSRYPDAYQSVIREWMKPLQPNSAQFLRFLRAYSELNPDDAIDVWAQLIRNFPYTQLGETAAFGLNNPFCKQALTARISQTWFNIKSANPQAPSADTPEILRLIRAYSKCQQDTNINAVSISCDNRRKKHASRDDSSTYNGYTEDVTSALSEVVDQLMNAAVSRRIAAIDFATGWNDKQASILNTFETARNTTEKAHALRALHEICDERQTERVLSSLLNGDEALRLEAASIIADYPQDSWPLNSITDAFEKETWPEIQLQLYSAINSRSDSPDFQKAIILGPKYALQLRSRALEDLTSNHPQSITLAEMESLITSGAPLNLIADAAEHIYQTQPEARPKLRTWIHAQQPFERRMLTTFARFMHVDTAEKDPAAIESMRAICSEAQEQENILQPCISYFEANAQTNEDRSLLENLQKRKLQFDAMMNIEF